MVTTGTEPVVSVVVVVPEPVAGGDAVVAVVPVEPVVPDVPVVEPVVDWGTQDSEGCTVSAPLLHVYDFVPVPTKPAAQSISQDDPETSVALHPLLDVAMTPGPNAGILHESGEQVSVAAVSEPRLQL